MSSESSEFINGFKMPLDDIFDNLDEILSQYNKDALTETDDTINDMSTNERELTNSINELQGLLKEDDTLINIVTEDNNEVGESLINDVRASMSRGKKIMSNESKEKLRLRQLDISKKLYLDALNNTQKSKDVKYVINAANNPKNHAMNNVTAIGMIPKDMRKQIITSNSMVIGQVNPNNTLTANTQQLPSPENGGPNPSGFLSSITKNPMRLFQIYWMGNLFIGLIVGIITLLVKMSGYVFNSLNNNHLANSLVEVPSTLNKDDFSRLTEMANKDKNGLGKWFINRFGKMQFTKDEVDSLYRSTSADGRVIETETLTTNVPAGVFGKNYNFTDSINAMYYNISIVTRYVAIGAAISAVILMLYKIVKKHNNKKKREQYATVNNLMAHEVNMEILYAENTEYYNEIQLIDESIGTWITSIVPTPTNITRLIDKGILGMVGLAKATQEGLQSKTLSPLFAYVCNFFIAIGEVTLIVSKGIMLGIMRATNNKNASKNISTMAQTN